jgi:hypothetical protein
MPKRKAPEPDPDVAARSTEVLEQADGVRKVERTQA